MKTHTTLLLLTFCLLPGQAPAAFEWINSTSGFWSEPANWQAADGTNRVPDGADEIKIRQGGETLLDSVENNGAARLRLYNGTMTIVDGAYLTIGWSRVGHTNADTATINQTGGVFDHTDGRLSLGNDYATGIWNISGGQLLSGGSGMFVGYTRSSGMAASTGRLAVIGSGPEIIVDEMFVGLGTVAAGDTGILEFQLDSAGVSPIIITESLELDVSGDDSIANLELSVLDGEIPPSGDIVLVNVTSAAAVSGAFDAMNGGSAEEGQTIVLGENIYSLTYTFDADSDGADNDIALLFVSGLKARAHDPVPVHSDPMVPVSLAALSWTNPDPNTPGTPITCDVYFGTDPNRLLMEKVTLDPDVSSIALTADHFPTFIPLQRKVWYYWSVDCHDPSLGSPPDDLIPGATWTFFTDENDPPTVDAGADTVAWLGQNGTPGEALIPLNATVTDDGRPDPPATVTLLWNQIDNGSPMATIDPLDAEVIEVTVMEAGVYRFMLTADDGEKQSSDIVEIIVGATACEASHMTTGDPYNPADINNDCIVDLADFAEMIAANWLDCTDTLTHCMPTP